MKFQPFELALLIAVVLASIELLTGTLILLGFSAGCLAVSAVEALSWNFSFGRDVIVFSVASAVGVGLLRFFFFRPGDSVLTKGDVNDY